MEKCSDFGFATINTLLWFVRNIFWSSKGEKVFTRIDIQHFLKPYENRSFFGFSGSKLRPLLVREVGCIRFATLQATSDITCGGTIDTKFVQAISESISQDLSWPGPSIFRKKHWESTAEIHPRVSAGLRQRFTPHGVQGVSLQLLGTF